ncbi:hypothetical protein AFLA_007551 [Aspergillus flavus NRRL3357]|nr:hypothetical protein AFLA_007551 [Aspergillus flavus NRRL3357]
MLTRRPSWRCSRIILKYAGRDATQAFEPINPPVVIEKHLPPELKLGPVAESNSISTTSNTPLLKYWLPVHLPSSSQGLMMNTRRNGIKIVGSTSLSAHESYDPSRVST